MAIYKGLNVRDDIEDHIFNETLRLFNEATAKGLTDSRWSDDVPDEFINQIRTNNKIWSAFRVHRMQNDIAAQLLDANGQLKSFDRWLEDIKGMTNHYVGPWLRTEYNTAVLRAHQAADWKHFEAEQDVFPNLRWMPTTSPQQDPLHRQYWESKLTLPLNHPFWSEHRPGDRWNCKCTLEQTDAPSNDAVIKDFYPVPQQPGLDNNPGEDGKLFSDSHPYIVKAYAGAQAAVQKKVIVKRQKTDDEKKVIRERWEERRLYRENMAEVAKELKMTPPKQSMNFDQANKLRGNPNYRTSKSYQINCQCCVVTNELRRRGFTVSARPNTRRRDSIPYRLSYQTELIWRDPKTGQTPVVKTIYGATDTAQMVEWNRQTAEAGRYHLRFSWKGYLSGHIITFERKPDGTGLFYDPQTGQKMTESQFYIDKIRPGSIKFYRVDNLRVDTAMISGAVVKQKI